MRVIKALAWHRYRLHEFEHPSVEAAVESLAAGHETGLEAFEAVVVLDGGREVQRIEGDDLRTRIREVLERWDAAWDACQRSRVEEL